MTLRKLPKGTQTPYGVLLRYLKENDILYMYKKKDNERLILTTASTISREYDASSRSEFDKFNFHT